MAQRSLKSSIPGMARAKKSFERKGWTQAYLATEVGLSSRQSIWKFFTGRPVENYLFKEICFKLDLDWEEIADLPQEQPPITPILEEDEDSGIESWVKIMRSQIHEQIQAQCNTLQSSFEVTQPLLTQIYTLVNIWPQPSNQRWLEVSDLQDQITSARLSLIQVNQEVVPGMEVVAQPQHSKLMILGKPGAGKTTFLQYLALQCNQGKYKKELIPLFIQLRNFTTEVKEEEDFSFLNYTIRQSEHCGVSPEKVTTLLQEGKFLVLLDGLDEIPQEEQAKITQEIDQFSQNFYKNQIIVTCRSGASNYHFRGFTYVEIADFNQTQIESFAKKWFIATANNKTEGLHKAEQFLKQLEHPENQTIRELGMTPILLALICSVFKERSSFPTKRSKLYQVGLDILLKRWDQARGIHRDQIYRYLSLADKIKLLCQIAATTFERGNYFFESSEILEIIEEYLWTLPNASSDLETLWLNSEAVLKAIELQHGLLVERARDIYSFSHLTFQEYLTARKIVTSLDSKTLEQELQNLSSRIFNSQWREVISLTASMLPEADFLIEQIKKQIDAFGAQEPQLQKCLALVAQKVSLMPLSYQASAIRAFYFTLLQNRDLNLAVSLDANLASLSNLPESVNLDVNLARILTDSDKLAKHPERKKWMNLYFSLDLGSKFKLEPKFQQEFEKIKSQLPDLTQDKDHLLSWWQTQGQGWVEQFRSMLIKHRQIGHNWQLSQQQQELWQQYYSANLFLVECLKSDCQVTSSVREEIEATLLLPKKG